MLNFSIASSGTLLKQHYAPNISWVLAILFNFLAYSHINKAWDTPHRAASTGFTSRLPWLLEIKALSSPKTFRSYKECRMYIGGSYPDPLLSVQFLTFPYGRLITPFIIRNQTRTLDAGLLAEEPRQLRYTPMSRILQSVIREPRTLALYSYFRAHIPSIPCDHALLTRSLYQPAGTATFVLNVRVQGNP